MRMDQECVICYAILNLGVLVWSVLMEWIKFILEGIVERLMEFQAFLSKHIDMPWVPDYGNRRGGEKLKIYFMVHLQMNVHLMQGMLF